MKILPLLTAGLVSAALLPTAAAAIPVTGPGTYTQDFDTLPTAPARAEFNWTDDVTIPGFYLHRSSGNPSLAGTLVTAASRPYIADGAESPIVAPNFHGFLSLGAFNSTERTLGFSPTGSDGPTNWAGGTLSLVALYTNTGTAPLELSQLAYDLEAWRANGFATNAETISVTYKVGAASALLAELGTASSSASFTQAGYADVDTTLLNYFSSDGFTALAAGARSVRLSSILTSPIRLLPGQSIAIRWGNSNDAGADAQVGIDNLAATFITVSDAVVSPTVTNIVRTDNPTSTNALLDPCVFDLTVTGTGPVSPNGWVITSPPVLAGITGSYGTTQTISGLLAVHAVAEGHTIQIVVADAAGGSSVTGTAAVTVPWCSITATAPGASYNDGGTLGAEDDTLSLQVSASGQWTGASYNIFHGGLLLSTQPYGPAAIPALPGGNYNLTFSDEIGGDCTDELTVHAPGPIGENALQPVALPVLSALATGARAWAMNTAGRTLTQNAATQVDHVVESQEINIAGIPGVEVSAQLRAITGGSSGFEAPDHFALDLIIDGGAPVSMLGSYDADADGLLEGAASNGSPDFVELPDAGETDSQITYTFTRVIPPGASTLKIRITGNSNSAAETFILQNLRVARVGSSLQASLAGPVFIDNRGTVDPADDMLAAPVNITPVSLGASTGWNTGLNAPDGPSSGLYSEVNPVLFSLGLPTAPETSRVFSIHDNLDNLKSATMTAPVPTRTFAATAANAVLHENGPGQADDTVTFGLTISGSNGGPEFMLGTTFGTATAASHALTGAPVTHTVTLSAAPAQTQRTDNNSVVVRVWDASYPASATNLTVRVPDPASRPPLQYVLGQKNFGIGDDVLSQEGVSSWISFPAERAISMINLEAVTVMRSQEVYLGDVGEVEFTARLRAFDSSSGFEESDTFDLKLIIDGNETVLVRVLDGFDLDVPPNGLEGAELAPAGGSISNPAVTTFNLHATIPASASSVKLLITAGANSISEQIVLDQVFFTSAPEPIVPGSATMAVNIGSSAKRKATSLAELAAGGRGTITVTAVQPGLTGLGGRVSLQDGWVIYEAAAGVWGADTFTYTLTDGVSTAQGIVVVAINVPEGPTMNIAGIVFDGTANHIAAFGIPGRTYRWEHSANLLEWQRLGEPAVCPAHGAMSITDPGPLPFRRYYRLAEIPANL